MAENLAFCGTKKAGFDAIASRGSRSVNVVERRVHDHAKTTDGARALQGSPPLHKSQAVSTKTNHAQSGVDPLDPFQPAYAVHRGDA